MRSLLAQVGAARARATAAEAAQQEAEAARCVAEEARRMAEEALHAQMQRLTRLPMLPVWGGAKTVFRSSSTLQVIAPAASAVRVDGIKVGQGRFAMRVVSGRHHVEHAGKAGTWRAGRWVDLVAGKTHAAPLRARPAASGKASSVGRRKRAAELARALRSSGRISRCVVPLRKQGLATGSFVVFDI